MKNTDLILAADKHQVSWEEILVQLKKDLILSGIQTDFFDEINSFKELIELLPVFIEELLQYYPELFSNLIYRIDIPEKQVENIATENLQLGFTELILKRLIQKVYFRKKYSG